MTDKFNPEAFPEEQIPEERIPSEDVILDEQMQEMIRDEIPEEEIPVEEILFDGNFDPEAFLPDDPEIPEEILSSEEAFPEITGESPTEDLPSEYMENYPTLPDSVEVPAEAVQETGFDDGGEFDQYFEQKTDGSKPAGKGNDRPTRKGRPKRPKGYGLFGIPHVLATVIWLMLIVAIGVSLGRAIWVCAADVLAFVCCTACSICCISFRL